MTLATISTPQIFSLPDSVQIESIELPVSFTPSPVFRILFKKNESESFVLNNHASTHTLTGANRVLAVIAPNDNFIIELKGGKTVCVLSLLSDLNESGFQNFNSSVLVERDNLLDEVVSQIVSVNPSLRNTIRFSGLTKTIISIIECRYSRRGKAMFAPKGKLSPEQMYKLLNLVNASIYANINLATLAAEVHLSEFHFSRLFRNTFGISPYQFVLQSKIECAKDILRQYPKSLSQIAHSLNFTDQAHFTNVFKKITGVPPTTYLASMTGRQRLVRP